MITPAEHRKQIEQYAAQRAAYEVYAGTLKRILEEGCVMSFPEVLVQSRAKTVSSFAEKAARKCDKYPDAVNQFTDLCGARVIVQTVEQVKAVQLFIEANFTILEKDDKGLLLSTDTFGYRDMHYIVQLPPERDAAFHISADQRQAIGGHKAEIQVRTWLQHAWADTLHDRMYKTRLTLSSDVVRTGALLAALMEEGDHTFDRLADDLDGLISNYTAFAKKEDVAKEIDMQRLILENEPKPEKRPALAMSLARLAAASGDHAEVVKLLAPHHDLCGANRCELLLELGYSLCRLHRVSPASTEYGRGHAMLEEALALCESPDVPFAPHLRKRESLHARVLARLGWAIEVIEGEVYEAREKYRQAHEHEPANPYYLAQMLGFEMYTAHSECLPDSMRATIREAIKTCWQHAVAGIELPYAHFTAGRLSLLIKEDYGALGFYARGLRHFLAGLNCMPSDVLSTEIEWLTRLHFGKKIPPPSQRVIDLLKLGQAVESTLRPTTTLANPLTPPVLIVAGGAVSIDAAQVARIRPMLKAALADFVGTVVAGGTAVGVPGCVGDIAQELAQDHHKRFHLLGYVPAKLPHDAPPHDGYDELVKVGEGFQPDQILRNWSDILAAGIVPRDVFLVGVGGGPIGAVEYRIALGLGASVGVVAGTEGAVKTLVDDPLWSRLPNLLPLPADGTTVRAFAMPSTRKFVEGVPELMAQNFHSKYVANSQSKLPANMRPWPKLDVTFQTANIEQAKYSVQILEAAGFGVREVEGEPTTFTGFTENEVKYMAELEHGRWNVERLRDGWRYGKDRDDSKKIHDCLVPWNELPEEIKKYDCDAVLAFPTILAKAKLEVCRLDGATG